MNEWIRSWHKCRRDGYRPSLILHEWRWEIVQSLPADPITDELTVDSRASGIRGQRGGVLVAQTPWINRAEIIVLDAAAWAETREWRDEFRANLETYTQDTAAIFLDTHPDALGIELNQEQAVRELQRRMLVTVSAATEVAVKDQHAVRVLSLSG